MARLLALLVSGPFPTQQAFCQALLVVEATHAASDSLPPDIEALAGRLDLDRARAAAKKLLAQQRTNLGMWGAYASLESQAGQYKVRLLHAKMRKYVQCMLANVLSVSAIPYCSLTVPASVSVYRGWLHMNVAKNCCCEFNIQSYQSILCRLTYFVIELCMYTSGYAC